MKIFGGKISPFIISITVIIVATVAICSVYACSSADSLEFDASFYFVCYRREDNSVSAGSISGTVSNYGGAGYILEYEKKFYVTVACYYSENDAQSVCNTLSKQNVDCTVLNIDIENYNLPATAYDKKQLYKGNLNTLCSLSSLAYECANAIDTGACSQAQAKSVLTDIASTLNELILKNGNNCFYYEFKRLSAECDDAAEGYIYSRQLRKLQIAIVDTVINIELY